jgi:hypothetical protein
MRLYQFTPDELMRLANHIREHLAYEITKMGIVDEKTGDIIQQEILISVAEPGFFGSILEKFKMGKPDKTPGVRVLVSRIRPPTDEEKKSRETANG